MNKYGILGWPLERSYSPVIHTFLLKHVSIEGKYELIRMNEINNKNIDQINKSYSGYNVTIPYKEKILEVCEEAHLDVHVKKIGSVNTVKNKDGITSFYNTDYLGFLNFLEIINFNPEGRKIMILGSGGSSKSINYALNLVKSEAAIISRTNKEEAISYQDLKERADEVEVIINTTPIGMPPYENETLDINVENFNNLELVMNIGYGPNNNFLTLFPYTSESRLHCPGNQENEHTVFDPPPQNHFLCRLVRQSNLPLPPAEQCGSCPPPQPLWLPHRGAV